MDKNHDIERLATALEKHTADDSTKFRQATNERRDIHESVKDLNESIKELKATLEPIGKAYNGFLFGKNFITGVASVVLAIGAIGAGVLAFIEFFVRK